jgi:hypothetical protein
MMSMHAKFNPKDIQIKTWSIQRTLDPLVAEVCYILIKLMCSAMCSRKKRKLQTFEINRK